LLLWYEEENFSTAAIKSNPIPGKERLIIGTGGGLLEYLGDKYLNTIDIEPPMIQWYLN
jgi:hypothetical protein